MDPTAINLNITADDFDTVLVYDDEAQWTTPDPSSSGFNGNDPAYLRGTYHLTDTKGAAVRLNFTGPAIYVYGHTGPRYGSFQVGIDSETIDKSAYAATEATHPTLLYSASNLTYATHSLTLTNLGASSGNGDAGGDGFLLDFVQWTIQAAPPGATIRNVTYQEDNAALTFSGVWGNNTSPAFSGGGSAFTNADQASVSMKFHGSAIYVMGDIKNDHRLYGVKLDEEPEAFYNGTSGCGGAFGQTCEQQVPILNFLGSNLDDSEHTITITNYAGVNNSFYDLDSIVVVVPSVYGPRQLVQNSSSPFVQPSGSATTSGRGTDATGTLTPSNSSPAANQASTGFSRTDTIFFNPVALILLLLVPLLRRKL